MLLLPVRRLTASTGRGKDGILKYFARAALHTEERTMRGLRGDIAGVEGDGE